jgi:hypothetical protein
MESGDSRSRSCWYYFWKRHFLVVARNGGSRSPTAAKIVVDEAIAFGMSTAYTDRISTCQQMMMQLNIQLEQQGSKAKKKKKKKKKKALSRSRKVAVAPKYFLVHLLPWYFFGITECM